MPRKTSPATNRVTQHFVEPPRQQRLFTPQQANQTLPLVRRIVDDLRHEHAAAKKLHDELCTVPLMDRGQRRRIGRQLTRSVRKLELFVEEIRSIGADVVDYRTATVEFAARIDDRPVVLSWRPGEERVDHWRELTAEDQRLPLATV
ncbi:MAG: DUF2203 family protein [Planctomycetota bacterium]